MVNAALSGFRQGAGMEFLPYGRQWIEDDDVAAVVAALRSERLAHGPRVDALEEAFAAATGAAEAVACSSGTAALQLALQALDAGPGQRCVVPGVTFLATATAALWCGADVVFADVHPDTGLLTPDTLAAALANVSDVRAVLPVHLGGRLCDLAGLARVAEAAGAVLVEDACHALGGIDAQGRPVGAAAVSHAAAFSLHPVKTLAAGEGGVATLNDRRRAQRMRRLRNHGVTRTAAEFTDPALSLERADAAHPWSYEQQELGHSLRMDEMSAALAISQLAKLPRFVGRRRRLASLYDGALKSLAPLVRPAPAGLDARPCPHLYTVLIDFEAAGRTRGEVMRTLHERGIGTQVHYIPVHRQPYMRSRYGDQHLPGCDAYYDRCLSLPLFPAMADRDVGRVAEALACALGR